jgi:hypothetical protein
MQGRSGAVSSMIIFILCVPLAAAIGADAFAAHDWKILRLLILILLVYLNQLQENRPR